MKGLKKVAILIAGVLSVGAIGALAACTPKEPQAEKHDPVAMTASRAYAVVQGYEWGPAVPKVVVEFPENASGFVDDTFAVSFTTQGWGGPQKTKRTVKSAYSSDANGVKTTAASKFVTVEMTVKYNECSPFVYNNMNNWAESIDFTVTVNKDKSFKVGSTTYLGGDYFTYSAKAADRKVPQTASWHKDTVTHEGITLQRASWAPDGAATDSGKNPLIIWLHGAGEGGTDIDIDLLGNEVTALTTENETNVQKYFAKDGLAGAYVLAVQTPTMWMDRGDGQYNQDGEGKQESKYTAALYNAITTYVDGNSDIDTDRIYIGGCSNGGYMTMNMMFEHGDYFAAYYPICEAYMNSRISDDMIAQVKDYNIWFLQSENDGTVNPTATTVPTYYRLLEAGAKNCWFTFTEKVLGTDDPDAKGWTGALGYDGHWSWIYAFNDQVTTRFDTSKVTSQDYLTSANCTVENVNLWSWMAAQSK